MLKFLSSTKLSWMKTLNTHAPAVIDCLIEAVLHSILLTPTNFPLTDRNNSSIIWLKGMKIYICTHCCPLLIKNKLPARCVLNGLHVKEIPDELLNLNALGRQLVQRAKPFQTIIRLGTHTGKVPVYNATKGLKGVMFFLPLPLQNTIDKLDSL